METTSNTITAYPLTYPTGWTRTPKHKVTASRFGTWKAKPTVWQAIHALNPELRLLRAKDVIISTNLRLRNDGLPMSTQKEPDDAGAAVYFTLNQKPRVLACDKWRTVGENLWAIAKHVEALRGQERWGVGTLDQAFTGYAALPAETGIDWHSALGLMGDVTRDEINQKYRKLLIEHNAHPDVGGDRAEFERLTKAREQALAQVNGNSH